MEERAGIKCSSNGSDIVSVRGEFFHYRRQGEVTCFDFSNQLLFEELYAIKEVIQLYEELISLN